jgi:hypothetical protein
MTDWRAILSWQVQPEVRNQGLGHLGWWLDAETTANLDCDPGTQAVAYTTRTKRGATVTAAVFMYEGVAKVEIASDKGFYYVNKEYPSLQEAALVLERIIQHSIELQDLGR